MVKLSGGTAMARITALLMLRSTILSLSAPATCPFRGSIRKTPRNRWVCFVAGVAVGSGNTHYQAARHGLTQTGLPPVAMHQLWLAPSERRASALRSSSRGSPTIRSAVCVPDSASSSRNSTTGFGSSALRKRATDRGSTGRAQGRHKQRPHAQGYRPLGRRRRARHCS